MVKEENIVIVYHMLKDKRCQGFEMSHNEIDQSETKGGLQKSTMFLHTTHVSRPCYTHHGGLGTHGSFIVPGDPSYFPETWVHKPVHRF